MVIVVDRKTATVYMEEPLVLNVVEVKNEMKDAGAEEIVAVCIDTL